MMSIRCQNTVQECSHMRILSTCGKTSRKQDKSFVISGFSEHRLVFGRCSCAPPRCSRQERVCFRCYSYISMEKPVFAMCSLSLCLNTLLTWLFLTRRVWIVWCSKQCWLLHETLVCLSFRPRLPQVYTANYSSKQERLSFPLIYILWKPYVKLANFKALFITQVKVYVSVILPIRLWICT